MKRTRYIFSILLAFLLLAIFACSDHNKFDIKVEEVSPWCIIGFDSLHRTPEQRVSMLKELGITKYGYNRGKGNFEEMKKEFDLAKANNLEIVSTFLWLNAKRDSIEKLSPSNQLLLDNLNLIEQKPTVWLSFSNNYFNDLSQEESIELSIQMIQSIKSKIDQVGCKLALYNHHGWFGNPFNQVEILERLNDKSISMVYNFHHAQEYVHEFPEIVNKISPYLSFVNLNGVKKEGPQILPIGQGDHEFEMIKELNNVGYNGPWGILGHIKTDDVRQVLSRNIKGLEHWNSTN